MCKAISKQVGEKNYEFLKFTARSVLKGVQCSLIAAIFTEVSPAGAFLIGGLSCTIKKVSTPLFEKLIPKNTSYQKLAKGTIKILHNVTSLGGAFLIASALFSISVQSAAFFYCFGSYIPSLVLLAGYKGITVIHDKVKSDMKYFYEHPEVT